MSYEDQVRRQMEEAANAAARGECPTDEEINAAFGHGREWLKRAGLYEAKKRARKASKKAGTGGVTVKRKVNTGEGGSVGQVHGPAKPSASYVIKPKGRSNLIFGRKPV